MAWVKIESRYPRHPKMVEAGALGIALDVCGICYAREHNTEGFIPDGALQLVGPIPNPAKVARALVAVGRWDRDDARRGWWIHDFDEYNPSAEADASAATERSTKASVAARARWDRQRARSNAPSNAQAYARPMPDACSADASAGCLGHAPLPSLELLVNNSHNTGLLADPERDKSQHDPTNGTARQRLESARGNP